MTLDWSVFCKDTLTGEAAPRCFSFLFGMDPNADPTYLDWLFTAWGWATNNCFKQGLGFSWDRLGRAI
ncbi:MAG: hypothetical protein RL082_1373 [Pseudomonadota bacterium]